MIAGFTGHQDLGSKAIVAWVRKEIKKALVNNSVEKGLTSLAVGADQLFASVLMEVGIPYVAIIPCERYEETFDRGGLVKYRYLLDRASECHVLGFEAPNERAYLEAGRQIVRQSALIIAVWDGKPARGLGGTADAVHYAQKESKIVVHINPLERSVGLI